MTLAEIIARFEAARPIPEPLADRAALTPLGVVAAQVVRLGYQLADLDRADRAAICSMLRALTDDITA